MPGQDYRETLLRNGNALLDLVQATGFALSSGGVDHHRGHGPR